MNKDIRRLRRQLLKHGKKILYSPQFTASFFQRHHFRTSVGEHSLQVAAISLWICDLLEKKGISLDRDVIVKAALMHDLGMIGRNERYRNNFQTGKDHPAESVKEAKKIYPELDPVTEQVILGHMWPLSLHAPKSLEGVVICIADKLGSITDLMPFAQRWDHRWARYFKRRSGPYIR